jgi:arsenical pump membrane protein
VRLARGSGLRLLLAVFIGVSVITFFTSNDIVILAMTPILIHVGSNARIRNLTPLLMTQFIAANTASMGLYIGNPTNIVIGRVVGIGFTDYAARMLVPTLVASATALLVVWALFGRGSNSRRIVDRYEVPTVALSARWTREMTIKVSLFGTCLATLAVLGSPWALSEATSEQIQERVSRSLLLVPLGFALVFALYDTVRDSLVGASIKLGLRRRLGRLPIKIVPFFLSFCVLLAAVEATGWTRHAVAAVVRAFELGPIAGSLASGALGIFAVNGINNIPATLLFEKVWVGTPTGATPVAGVEQQLALLNPSYGDIFVDASLYASNFGANLTFIGALAGLMWFRLIRNTPQASDPGIQVPTVRQFMAYGLLIVPIVTVVTCLSIALWRGALP